MNPLSVLVGIAITILVGFAGWGTVSSALAGLETTRLESDIQELSKAAGQYIKTSCTLNTPNPGYTCNAMSYNVLEAEGILPPNFLANFSPSLTVNNTLSSVVVTITAHTTSQCQAVVKTILNSKCVSTTVTLTIPIIPSLLSPRNSWGNLNSGNFVYP